MVIILISTTLSTVGATADITAQYEQEPFLQFEQGSGPYPSSKLIALLGTMTVTCNNPPASLKQPALIISHTNRFKFSELDKDTREEKRIYGFSLEAVSYNVNTSTYTISPMTMPVVKLFGQSTINNISSLEVRIYFVADENSSAFVPGAIYKLTSGTIGTFNLAVAPESTNIDDVQVYISVNGQEIPPVGSPPLPGGPSYPPTSPAIPIVGTGGGTTTLPSSVPYVDDDHPPLLFLLSIINERTINLFEAYGTEKTRVAKANIEILNAETGSEYKVNIKFDSSSVSQGSFNLHLDGNHNLYGIPYTLFFKQQEVVPGDFILWKHLKPGSTDNSNTKAIEVTGVAQIIAEAAPAGTYSDTITVTIIPVDTL